LTRNISATVRDRGQCSRILLLFFAKHSLDLISLEIVNRHALSYVLVQVTANAPLVQVKLLWVTDNP